MPIQQIYCFRKRFIARKLEKIFLSEFRFSAFTNLNESINASPKLNIGPKFYLEEYYYGDDGDVCMHVSEIFVEIVFAF